MPYGVSLMAFRTNTIFGHGILMLHNLHNFTWFIAKVRVHFFQIKWAQYLASNHFVKTFSMEWPEFSLLAGQGRNQGLVNLMA